MGLGSILHHKYNKEPQNHILIIEATTVGLPNSISPSSRDETDSRESGGGGGWGWSLSLGDWQY